MSQGCRQFRRLWDDMCGPPTCCGHRCTAWALGLVARSCCETVGWPGDGGPDRMPLKRAWIARRNREHRAPTPLNVASSLYSL